MSGSRPARLETVGVLILLCLAVASGFLASVYKPSQASSPRVFAQSSSGPDFSMQIEPSQSLMRNGTTVTPGLSFTPMNSFVGNVTVMVTVSPSGAYSPQVSFPYSYVTLNASIGGSPLYFITVSTTNMTPSGLYTITATGTSGSISHTASATIGVTSVFVPANSAELLYSVAFDSQAYIGGSTNLNATFTDLGYVQLEITKIVVSLDFGTYEGVPSLMVSPYTEKPSGVSGITIPSNVSPGPHTFTVTISWILDPFTIYETPQNDIVIHGTLNVYANNFFPGASLVPPLVLAIGLVSMLAAAPFSILFVRQYERNKQALMSQKGRGGSPPTIQDSKY